MSVMACKASVRYWPGRKGGGYFCVFQGKRYELALGPNDAPSGSTCPAALDAFMKVVKGKPAKPAPTGESIRFVLDTYLKHISRMKKAAPNGRHLDRLGHEESLRRLIPSLHRIRPLRPMQQMRGRQPRAGRDVTVMN